MSSMSLDDVQSRLSEIIEGLNPGEPLVIVKDGEPVATLTRREHRGGPSIAGSARTEGYWMSPDFDAPLDEFREYME
jgi:antitoxin (DNA-binding transcriptional repressor) of toxin-antitoxin stability system